MLKNPIINSKNTATLDKLGKDSMSVFNNNFVSFKNKNNKI